MPHCAVLEVLAFLKRFLTKQHFSDGWRAVSFQTCTANIRLLRTRSGQRIRASIPCGQQLRATCGTLGGRGCARGMSHLILHFDGIMV